MKKLLLCTLLLSYNMAAPQYRKIVLDNELKVILVSDDQYNKSGISKELIFDKISTLLK